MSELARKDQVVLRFAGDSGDGMQLAGDRLTDVSAAVPNDLATAVDFPAEIRAPAGTVHGVSAFQIQFGSEPVLTPGDRADVLVAMNAAALKANLDAVTPGATVIVNGDGFDSAKLRKAGYDANPLEDGTLAGYDVHRVPMTTLSVRAAEGVDGLPRKDAARTKNLFALGLVSWMYSRPAAPIIRWIQKKFAGREALRAANIAAFESGWNYGETLELLGRCEVPAVSRRSGVYRRVNGTTATALGLVAASARSGLPLFYAGYPITPASALLHELARHGAPSVRTMQAEDEIAAASLVLGAAFGGHLGVTGTSGPGLDLKTEVIGLAVALELPMVVIDVQRAGPSTGMPTKTEASDLLLAVHGRHGESPVPVLAAPTPAGCFDAAIESCRIALTYRTPVVLLSDAFLASSAQPWRIPDVEELPQMQPGFVTECDGDQPFRPYARDERTLARAWALPGTPGLMHRIGGLEKRDGAGDISYDGDNHRVMTEIRAAKIRGIATDVPDLAVDDPDGADLLVLGWGSSFGALSAAVREVRRSGGRVAFAHLIHLNPFPSNVAEVLRRYERVLVPEMNMGQLAMLLRAEFLVPVEPLSNVAGRSFSVRAVREAIEERL